MQFVFPGPGAIDGITKCFKTFGDYNQSDIIKYATENQHHFFNKLELKFKNLFGRDLQLIDCQNLFCEVDKYARLAHPKIKGVSGRTRIKQIYKAKAAKIDLFFPPKWNIRMT